MGTNIVASFLVICPVMCCADLPVLEGTALWLEQVPGTTDVLVVGSWTGGWIDDGPWSGLQGWS